MPENLRQLLVNTFAKLPYRVLWKYESTLIQNDLPPNVKISRWLPQQDVLGHKKLRAFITHGGLLSMYETVYHGAPAVVMPVFCDHDSNSEKAKADGYGEYLFCNKRLDFSHSDPFYVLNSSQITFGDTDFGEAVQSHSRSDT